MTGRDHGDVVYWASRAPHVPDHWFRRRSWLHGVSHTQRVHIHAQRLVEQLAWGRDDAALVLQAALWHDIGRRSDGIEPGHGARSAARADELGLTAALPPDDAAVVRFAVVRHSRSDGRSEDLADKLSRDPDEARHLVDPERALRVLWLLKDADALDRIRLGFGEHADSRQLRHPETVAMIGFAAALYATLP